MSRYLFFNLMVSLMATIAFLFAQVSAQASSAEAATTRLLIFGDSLVAGYGLPPETGFPEQLQAALNADGVMVDVINGGISGDTTAGGASRIAWSLEDAPDAVVVVLGGNDALRGLPPDDLERNLDAILLEVQDRGIPVLLAGMRAPANLGPDYEKAFNTAFLTAVDTASGHSTPMLFYPFFLDGVALEPTLNQNDGIHPNIEGVAIIVEKIRPMVDKLLMLAAK
jgi:acyl-CoA thioesterase-1